jgi:hypothetical protein
MQTIKTMINLTQHPATSEQNRDAIMVEPLHKEVLKGLLTFSTVPDRTEILSRANKIALFAKNFKFDCKQGNIILDDQVLIGGLPALMGPLEQSLRAEGFVPFYSHSDRVSVEKIMPDGTVQKTNEFKHIAFYEGAV